MTLSEGIALACVYCSWRGRDRDAARCPECDGQLAPIYEAEAFDETADEADAAPFDPDALRPTGDDAAVTLGEGGTPLVECPTIADELGVDAFAVKDEGHNPTGTIADRAIATAVTAAAGGADDVALPTTGADGVAAAAYAARAGVDAHVFVPTRSTHTTKAMINVHGGDMSVVEGRLPDAAAAFRSAVEEEADWIPIDPANAPLRAAGLAPILPELFADLDGQAPDAVVVSTASGEVIAGLHAAATLLVDLGVLDDVPPLYAVQAEGCSPIVRAVEEDADPRAAAVEPWETPDTISGALEVPDPAFGARAIDAIEKSGGGAVAVDDEAILASACRIAAAEGLEVSVAGGAGAAGAWELSNQDVFDPDDTVVLLNTGAGSLDSDVLRSHLMRAG